MFDFNRSDEICSHFVSTTSDVLFCDVEYTFPEPPDQTRRLIEIHIEDTNGQPIFNSAINPGINLGDKFFRKGLPNHFLQLCPKIEHVESAISALIKGKTLVLWGADGDRVVFPNKLNAAGKILCAMERFAPFAGEYSHYHGNYKWASLDRALEILSIPKPIGIPHRAATDARALRLVWEWMENTSIAELLSEAARNRHNPFDPFP